MRLKKKKCNLTYLTFLNFFYFRLIIEQDILYSHDLRYNKSILYNTFNY